MAHTLNVVAYSTDAPGVPHAREFINVKGSLSRLGLAAKKSAFNTTDFFVNLCI